MIEASGWLKQLPGLAVQRLMAEGYGFGGEGDWKTCALVRATKVIAADLRAAHHLWRTIRITCTLRGRLVLGSHMLEVCESIAAGELSPEVQPLGIGVKEAPIRLVFNAPAGAAINAFMIDLGNRFRVIVNKVDAVEPLEPLPKLPVASAVWKCRPDFKTSLRSMDLCRRGSSHRYNYCVTAEHLEDLAEIAGVESVVIDAKTELRDFKRDLSQNEI